MNDAELLQFAQEIIHYCNKYQIPQENFIEILEDQKVLPMLRGKGMEFNAYWELRNSLPQSSWSIEKLNLNAQPGFGDEDISITHKKTGIILKVESKSAVRGSIRDGVHTRIINEPHFKVKCHRSRSNIKLAKTSNDRYDEKEFDIIMTNPVNSLFKGNTIGEKFEFVTDGNIGDLLYKHYNVSDDKELVEKAGKDWRFVYPPDISENGFVPRTPYVKLNNDKNWHKTTNLEEYLLKIVKIKRATSNRRS